MPRPRKRTTAKTAARKTRAVGTRARKTSAAKTASNRRSAPSASHKAAGAATRKRSAGKTTATRKPVTRRSAGAPSSRSSGTLVCPECGKTFTRAASLGAHRNRAHGIVGAAAKARSAAGAAGRKTRVSNGGSRAGGRSAAPSGIDRDALLAALFPEGIPAKESVIRQLDSWLSEGERLANLS